MNFLKKIGVAIVGIAMAVGVAVGVFSNNKKVSKVDAAGTSSTQYSLINSTNDLQSGKSYIITNGISGTVKAIARDNNSNNRKTTDVTVSSDLITRGDSAMSFTLGGSSGAWTFYTENYAGTAGYLASAASGSNNYLRVISTAGTATISFSGDEAVINIGPHTSRTQIRYNTSNLFACYSSGQQAIYLWKEVSSAPAVVINTVTVTEGGNSVIAGSTVTKSSVAQGSTLQLAATVTYTGDPGAGTVNWASSSQSVATVNQTSGLVTYVGDGDTTITATPTDGTNKNDKVFSFTLRISGSYDPYDYATDTINNAKTSANLGNTATSAWATDFTASFSSGASYYIHSMGTKDSARALSWNNNGYLYATASGGTLKSITINGDSGKSIKVYAQNSAYSAQPSGDPLTTVSLTGSNVTYNFTSNYTYLGLFGGSSATGITSVVVTWKFAKALAPLEGNPELSTGSSVSISVGKTISLNVTTNPANSDEKLLVASGDLTKVSVSGSGKSFTLTGVAITNSPVTVTVAGAKGKYQSTVAVTVTEPVKSVEDKVLTMDRLGLTNSYDKDSAGTYSNDGVDYKVYYVMKNSGCMQFHGGDGYIYNDETLTNSATNGIKTVTLIMKSSNTGTAAVYQGASKNPSSEIVNNSFSTTGINKYSFSANMPYFKVMSSSGTVLIDYIIVELVDGASDALGEARTAANTILDRLDGLCGTGASGIVTSSQWSSLSSALTSLSLSDDAKDILKNAVRVDKLNDLDLGTAVIENAMYHYDACVVKFGFTPDTNITLAASNITGNLMDFAHEISVTTIILIISAAGIAAVGGYFLLKKRKEI